ncbi:unnamed protein product [Miscanthus lutarioriparius]|uniref:Transcription repressor n=1 Tax=Miscanthus lutarioriparius TaxID=422564 RepID=A0A811PDA4_9POAL|nr:unnamed protein product [Miscanthus lutarioriparius]
MVVLLSVRAALPPWSHLRACRRPETVGSPAAEAPACPTATAARGHRRVQTPSTSSARTWTETDTPFMDKSPHRRDSAGGRLKQRLARILTRSTCTTSATAAAGSGGGTAFVSLAKTNTHSSHTREPEAPYFCTPCTYERPKAVDGGTRSRRRRRRSRSASLIHISVDCTGGAGAVSGHSDAPLLQHLLSVPARDVVKKQSKGGRGRSKPAPRSPSASRWRCSSPSSYWGRARRPSSTPTPYSWSSSSSSTATDDELAPFSGSGGCSDEEGGDEAETRTLFSSSRPTPRPSSTTPSPTAAAAAATPGPGGTKQQHRECNNERNKEEKGLNVGKLMMTGAAAAEETTAGGAGMAVVKCSSNPYLDFRSSMVEMVVERRIGSVAKMEELLGSYLSLNSPRHHPAMRQRRCDDARRQDWSVDVRSRRGGADEEVSSVKITVGKGPRRSSAAAMAGRSSRATMVGRSSRCTRAGT